MLFCKVHVWCKYKVDVDCVPKWRQSWCWLCSQMKTVLMLIVWPDVDCVARYWLCGQMKTVLMLIVWPDVDCVARWRQCWCWLCGQMKTRLSWQWSTLRMWWDQCCMDHSAQVSRWVDWWFLYSAVLYFQADSLQPNHMQLWMSDCSFTPRILNIHQSGVLRELSRLLHGCMVPCEAAVISAYIPCTPCDHAQFYRVIRSHIHGVYGCLAVTCHLHFW